MREPKLCKREMFKYFGRCPLGLSEEENSKPPDDAGLRALEASTRSCARTPARPARAAREAEDRLGIVLLARPYHNDPGMNHEIPDELQKLGYPIFTIHSLPLDDEIVARCSRTTSTPGDHQATRSTSTTCWKNSYSENTNQKIWAAKFAARHPNLVALELSSFKCGHDAPIYTVIEEIVETSGTPYFSFKDIDENKPTGSIKIRTETIGYFLKRYEENLKRDKPKREKVAERLRQYQAELMARLEAAQAKAGGRSRGREARRPARGRGRSAHPRAVDKRYKDLHVGKMVNEEQSEVLNKTAGAHRGANLRGGATTPTQAPADQRED